MLNLISEALKKKTHSPERKKGGS